LPRRHAAALFQKPAEDAALPPQPLGEDAAVRFTRSSTADEVEAHVGVPGQGRQYVEVGRREEARPEDGHALRQPRSFDVPRAKPLVQCQEPARAAGPLDALGETAPERGLPGGVRVLGVRVFPAGPPAEQARAVDLVVAEALGDATRQREPAIGPFIEVGAQRIVARLRRQFVEKDGHAPGQRSANERVAQGTLLAPGSPLLRPQLARQAQAEGARSRGVQRGGAAGVLGQRVAEPAAQAPVLRDQGHLRLQRRKRVAGHLVQEMARQRVEPVALDDGEHGVRDYGLRVS
jgi:hypothetical protein